MSMDDQDLHAVLHRATQSIDAPVLAGRAVVGARSRRARRRGLVAAATSSAVVAAVVIATHVGGTPSVAPPTTPSSAPASPTGVPNLDADASEPAIAPMIDPATVQPTWDPADVRDLPLDASVSTLDVLEPSGPVGAVSGGALVAADVDGLSWLWGADGGWRSTAYPEPAPGSPGRSIALTPDGSELVVTGRTALWTRSTDSQRWNEVAYPSGFRTDFDYYATVAAFDDGRILLGQYRRFWLLDPDGLATRLPFDALDEVVPAGDDVLAERFAQPLTQVVEEWRGGAVVRATDSSTLQSLQRPVADASSIALTRARTSFGRPAGVTESDGLLALSRDGLISRAFLPVSSAGSYYSDNNGLTALDWLDSDTVLAEVRPRNAPDVTFAIDAL